MPNGDKKTMALWREALQKAEQGNVAVICSDRRTTHASFTWGGCLPWLDRDDPSNFAYAAWPAGRDSLIARKIILPCR